MKEARFEQEGFSGLSQLREPYDVKLTMFGNLSLYPGAYIYVDPRGLGSELGRPQSKSSLSFLLGLGGYYMVIKSENTITESGTFETVVIAKWVGNGGSACENQPRASVGRGDCPVIDVPEEEEAPPEEVPYEYGSDEHREAVNDMYDDVIGGFGGA